MTSVFVRPLAAGLFAMLLSLGAPTAQVQSITAATQDLANLAGLPPVTPDDQADDGQLLFLFFWGAGQGPEYAQAGTTYEFPQGTYDIYATPAYLNPAVGYAGTVFLRTDGLNLKGLGSGAKFVWHGFDPGVHHATGPNPVLFPGGLPGSLGFFRIENCSNVTIENFEIGMSRAPHTSGEVVLIYPGIGTGGYIHVFVTDPAQFINGPLGGAFPAPVSVWDYHPDGTAQSLFSFTGPSSAHAFPPFGLVGQVIRLDFDDAIVQSHFSALAVGDRVAMKHQYYNGNAFTALECGGLITIKDCVITACPGMGVLASRCNDVTVDNVDVRPVDPNHLFSSTADGIHVRQTGGVVDVRNCDVTYCGDDCFAFLGIAGAVTQTTPSLGQVRVQRSTGPNSTPDIPWQQGEVLEFRTVDGATIIGTATLQANTEVTVGTETHVILTLVNVAPHQVGGDFWVDLDVEMSASTAPAGPRVYSLDETPTSIDMELCTGGDNRGHGVVISQPNAQIRLCEFERTSAAGILGEIRLTRGPWILPGPNGLLVDQCEVRNCNVGLINGTEAEPAAVNFRAFYRTDDEWGESTPGPVGAMQGITITDSWIEDTRFGGIIVGSASGVTVTNNLFERVSQAEPGSAGSYEGTTVTLVEKCMLYLESVLGGTVTGNASIGTNCLTYRAGPAVSGVVSSPNTWVDDCDS